MRFTINFLLLLTLTYICAVPTQESTSGLYIGQNKTYHRSELIKPWICAYAIKYNVDPTLAMAVAHIESRKGQREFRTGCMGRTYYGPMGIYKCFLKRWAVDHTEINIAVGVRALAGVGQDASKQKKRLKGYNVSFNHNYWLVIQRATSKYRKEG